MRQASRRVFLRTAVIASTAAAVPVAVASSAEALVRRPRATRLRRAMFTPHVGTSFLLRTRGGTTYRAVLLEISDAARAAGDQRRFGLTFRIAGGARPADGTYTVSHKRLRAFPLYVGAIDRAHRGLYEAVVNA